jgi:RNA polymerase sigma-70 factor (ECF subfamily)
MRRKGELGRRVTDKKIIRSHYLTHRDGLVRYVHTITGDRDQAEDVVQEAYLRLDQTLTRRLLEDPGRYLFRIVRNLALDGRRRGRRDGRLYAADPEALLEQASDDQPSPETETLARDEYERLLAALAMLPERTRIAVEMHRFGGAKLREVAAELGVSLSVAHQLVVEGVAHCRDRLRR